MISFPVIFLLARWLSPFTFGLVLLIDCGVILMMLAVLLRRTELRRLCVSPSLGQRERERDG